MQSPSGPAPLSVVVAHDYLTQRGGAERVAIQLALSLGAERLITAVYRPDLTFAEAAKLNVHQLGPRLLRPFSSDPRRALPLLAGVWDRARPIQAEVLICSSSGWAHALGASQDTMKVVYCHNPARWLYQADDYLVGVGRVTRIGLGMVRGRLTKWDRAAAATAQLYIANSTSVRDRIYSTYGIEAEVVHPPVSIDITAERVAVGGLRPGFFLTVGRARGYKGADALIKAFAKMQSCQLVMVGVEPSPRFPPNVLGLGRVSDGELRWLYANARGLVSVSREDFGLTPIEANSFGTPSLVVRAGGFLDSTDPGVSGEFIASESPQAIVDAVSEFPEDWDRDAIRRHAAKFSPETFGRRILELARAERR